MWLGQFLEPVHIKWLQLLALSKSWLSEDTNYTDQFPCRITAAKRIALNGFREWIEKRFGCPLTQDEDEVIYC